MSWYLTGGCTCRRPGWFRCSWATNFWPMRCTNGRVPLLFKRAREGKEVKIARAGIFAMSARRIFSVIVLVLAAMPAAGAASHIPAQGAGGDLVTTSSEVGVMGGRLVVSLRAEPKTLNPVLAVDQVSRDVIRCLQADLIHINRLSQRTEPALAKSWKVSPDGRRYTLQLRSGLRFSDGHLLGADDVVFTFQVYQDEKINSPQRDLLIIGGQPIRVEKVDATTVRFELAQPYAAAERIFDSLAVLPRHLLEKPYQEGKFSQAWALNTEPGQLAGLGPFRVREYVPGQRLVLERNPHYWKQDRKGNRLPYLNEVEFLIVPNQDAQVIRFQGGDTDVLDRISAENYNVLEREQAQRGYRLYDLGPGLEFNFLFFNLD